MLLSIITIPASKSFLFFFLSQISVSFGSRFTLFLARFSFFFKLSTSGIFYYILSVMICTYILRFVLLPNKKY